MKGKFRLLAFALLLTAATSIRIWAEPPTAATIGPSYIPEEIRDGMEQDVLAALTAEPKYVALTFDDGPRADTTGKLLDGLAERGICATFFVIGQQINGCEDILRRMAAEGHQIGNHTYSHAKLCGEREDRVVEEIRKTEVLLENLLGVGEYWLRPPYGLIESRQAALVGTPMIYWTLDPEDWKLLNADQVTDQVVGSVQPGDIILLHDFYPSSVEAALRIVDLLQAQGYTFVTVEELFRLSNVAPEKGVLYAAPEIIRPVP